MVEYTMQWRHLCSALQSQCTRWETMEIVQSPTAISRQRKITTKKDTYWVCLICMLLISDTEFQVSSRLLIVVNLLERWMLLITKEHGNLELLVFVSSWDNLDAILATSPVPRCQLNEVAHKVAYSSSYWRYKVRSRCAIINL